MGIIEIALCIWKNKRTSVRPQRYPIGDMYVNEIGKGNGNPLQYSCLENSVDRELVGFNPWGRKELDTTEHTVYLNEIDKSTFL